MLAKLILDLDTIIRNVEACTLETPPEDYAKFREMVGMRKGLLKAKEAVLIAYREQDDL